MPVQSQALVDPDHCRKIQLFTHALRSFGCSSLRVTGTSMWPELWPGDTVEIRSIAIVEIRVGDLAAFTRDERIFVHRVVGATVIDRAPVLITRGDALSADDAPVLESELLGIASLSQKVPRTWLRRLRQEIHHRFLTPAVDNIQL